MPLPTVAAGAKKQASYPYYLQSYRRDKDDEIIEGFGYRFYVTTRSQTLRSSLSKSKEVNSAKTKQKAPQVSEPIKKDEVGQNNEISSFPKDPSIYQGTTWLQCLTYTQLPKDETESIEAFINHHFSDSLPDDNDLAEIRLTGGFESGEWAFSVGPVLQIISVTISNESDFNLSSIHGEISVPNCHKKNCYIFKRESHDPLLLVSRQLNYLPLDDCPLIPVIAGRVKFSITNGVDDCQIFDGYCDVDESIDDANEKKSTLQLLGKNGCRATMEFIKIPFALIAEISLFLVYTLPSTSTNSVSGDESFKVHGKIIVNKVTCFNKKSEEEGVTIVPREKYSFFHSKRAFAVPVCSPLVFEVELFRGGLKVLDDTLKFHPDGNARYGLPPTRRLSIPCQDENYSFVMHLSWMHHNEFFNDVEVPSMDQTPAVAAGGEVLDLNPPFLQTDTVPSTKIHPSEGPNADDYWDNYLKSIAAPPVTSSDYVEVFSVFIGGGILSTPPALVGLIGILDGDGTVYVFSRDANCPDKLSNEQFRNLSIAWPTNRCIKEKKFFMFLDLEDDQGREVCWGSLRLDCIGYLPPQPDARLCYVIPSKDCGYFAAVHYSIFKNGKRAKVSVEWEGEEDILVYGSVVAQYSNHTYPSAYDKEFYRSIVFRRAREDAVIVKKSAKIPLSKSYVSAPSDCEGLTIHVNLKYCPFNDYSNESIIIGNNLQFKAGEAKSEILEGIKVEVEWPQNSSNGSSQ